MTDRKKCDMINSYIKIHTIDLQNQTEHLS